MKRTNEDNMVSRVMAALAAQKTNPNPKSNVVAMPSRGIGRTTRDESYRTFTKEDAAGVDDAVYRFLLKFPSRTRQEIAEQADMALETVCGAVHRLMSEGMIVEDGVRRNPATNRNRATLAVTAKDGGVA